ncbi:MAG: hypothetical protein AAFR45_00090, partial [Pseudomonadota bacterium]
PFQTREHLAELIADLSSRTEQPFWAVLGQMFTRLEWPIPQVGKAIAGGTRTGPKVVNMYISEQL